MPIRKIYRLKYNHISLIGSIIFVMLFGAIWISCGITTMRGDPGTGLVLIGVFMTFVILALSNFLAEVHAIIVYQSGWIEFRRPWPGMTQRMNVEDIYAIYHPTGWKRLRMHGRDGNDIFVIHANGTIVLSNGAFEHFDDLLVTLKTFNPGITFDGLDRYTQNKH